MIAHGRPDREITALQLLGGHGKSLAAHAFEFALEPGEQAVGGGETKKPPRRRLSRTISG